MKNWKTTLAGLITGIALVVKGILMKDPAVITAGVGAILHGIVSADSKKEEY